MIRLAFGVPGAGKSLALQDIVNRELFEKRIGFAIVDRAGEWQLTDARTGAPNARWRGNPPTEMHVVNDNPMEHLQWARDNKQAILFPHPWEGRDVAELVQAVGDLVYVDDEIDLAALNNSEWKENPIRDFVHRGRHLPDIDGYPRQVHIYGAARRVQNLHSDLTSMSDEALIFRCQGHRTLKRLTDEGMLSEEMQQECRTMENLEYFLWKSSGEISRGKLKPIV